MKRLLLSVAIALIGAGTLTAQPSARVVPLDSELYPLIDSLFRESGRATPNGARPWTCGDFSFELSRLERKGLSEAGRKAWERIDTEITREPAYSETWLGFDFRPALSPEFFAHIPLSGTESNDSEDYTWIHGYEERPAFLTMPFELSFGQSVYADVELVAKEEHNTVRSGLALNGVYPVGVSDNRWNVVFDDPEPRIDLHFPFRAFLSLSGPFWDFKFGRDKASWGNGRTGNFMLSDYPDYYDLASLSFHGERFRLSSLYASLDPFLPNSADLHPQFPQEDYSAFIGHRLDWEILGVARLSFCESVVLGAPSSAAQDLVHDLNFLMVFHNWTDPARMNSLLTVELSASPLRYVNLHGQLAMDEFETAYEAARGGNGGPNVFAYQAGADASIPLGGGYLGLYGEWSLTSPWLYNRKNAPYYYDVRHYYSLTTDNWELVVKPLGYRYGPHAIVWFLGADYRVPGGWNAGLSLTYVRKGEKSILDSYLASAGDEPPTGVEEDKAIIAASVSLPAGPWMRFHAGINFISTENSGHIPGATGRDLELFAGMTLARQR